MKARILRADHLAGHQDREARRIGNDEAGGDRLAPSGHGMVDAAVVQPEVFAVLLVVGHEVGASNVALRRAAIAVLAKGRMEATEVRQGRQVLGQGFDLALVELALQGTGILEALVDLPGDVHQNFDQVGRRAARRADVRHEEHAVSRGLVDLNTVAIHQDLGLEGVAVESGGADQERDARRVHRELVAGPGLPDVVPAVILVVVRLDTGLAILRGDQIADAEQPEVFAEQRVGSRWSGAAPWPSRPASAPARSLRARPVGGPTSSDARIW